MPLVESRRYLFSPDGRTMLATGYDSAERWDFATRTEIRPWLRHPAVLTSAEWSPDGKFVVTSCGDRGVRVWDAAGKPIGSPVPHPMNVVSAELSPDGKTLLTACGDGSVRLWDFPSGRLIAPPFQGAIGARFSPDGSAVWAVVGRQRVSWPLPTCARRIPRAVRGVGSGADRVATGWERIGRRTGSEFLDEGA